MSFLSHITLTSIIKKLGFTFVLFLLSACGSAPKSSTEVFIVGTAHGKHLQGDFPLSIFYEIIKNNKMDLILIETPEPHVKKNLWTHTTPEMVLIKYYAEQMQLPVIGVDALKLPAYPQNSLSEIKKTHEKLNKFIDKYTFDKLNNPQTLNHLKSLSSDIAFSNEHTRHRNKTMVKNILKEIKKHKAQRVIVFTGFKHRYELEKDLHKYHKITSPLNLSITSVNDTKDNSVPQAVRQQWLETQKLLKQKLQAKSQSLPNDKINKKIQLFNSFAKEE